jgi:hypothetical protein
MPSRDYFADGAFRAEKCYLRRGGLTSSSTDPRGGHALSAAIEKSARSLAAHALDAVAVIQDDELEVEALQHRPDLKVLFMTGYSRNAVVRQGRLDPGIEMIQKRMSQRELVGGIRDLLDTAPRAQPALTRR